MEKISGVYMIKNTITNKVYIGSSKDVYKRWYQHKRELNKGIHSNTYLNNAWKKYGESSFEFSLLEKCSIDNLIILEQAYLDTYKCYERHKGYNICEKAYKPPMTEESRRRQAESLKQNKSFIEKSRKALKDLHSDPERQAELIKAIKSSSKVQETRKVLNNSIEHKKKFLENSRKYKLTEDYKEHIHTLASRNKQNASWRSKHNVKQIEQCDMEGNIIACFDSIRDIENKLQKDKYRIDRGAIAACCKGFRTSYKGFIWRYKGSD